MGRMITEKEKMIAGELYNPEEMNLVSMRAQARKICAQYNRCEDDDVGQRAQLLEDLLGSAGQNPSIHANFRCDYGFNIHVGDNFFANYDCIILDCAEVRIGDNCFLGPQIGIYTACHPLDPVERVSSIEFARPVTIGNRCWIGGHAVINPGVTLGNNVVVASGSVVTKSFGDNVVIGGNPARVIRVIETEAEPEGV